VENKARYTVVGLFLMLFSVAMVAFVLWQARFSLSEKKFFEYRIYSKNSIAGLKENSFVEYKGLVIGSIKKIGINPNNIEQIEIILKINQPEVIKKDSFAIIQSQGITGNKNIEIDGGSLDSESLIPKDNEFISIPLHDSFFDSLTKDAGDITQNINSVLVNINALLNKQNLQNISTILSNFEQSSEMIIGTLEKVDTVMVKLNKILEKDVTSTLNSIGATSKEWEELSKDMQNLVKSDIKKLLEKLNGKIDETKGLDELISNINATLEKVDTTLDNFNTNGGDLLFKTRDLHYGPKESFK